MLDLTKLKKVDTPYKKYKSWGDSYTWSCCGLMTVDEVNEYLEEVKEDYMCLGRS